MHSPASTENLLFWRTCARWYDRFVNRAFPEYLDIVDRIVADATPSDRLLEVATGTGNVALSLAKGCGRIDAIDYSPGMVTVGFSDAVGEILISNPTVKDRRPNFKFYI